MTTEETQTNPDSIEVLPGYVIDWAPEKPKRKQAPEALFAEFGMNQRYFSTEESAFFFERSPQWIYWLLRQKIARCSDGTPVSPLRMGSTAEGRRRFTLENLNDIAESAYQRGNLREEEMHRSLKRMMYAREGLDIVEIANLVPWPKQKLAKLIRAKEVHRLEDLSTIKRQMIGEHRDLLSELRAKNLS